MIIGNSRAQKIIENYFTHISEQREIAFPFLLLHGPNHIGKTTFVEKKIAALTGMFAAQDYRAVYDLSEKLGKKQPLRVEVAEKDQRVEIDDTTYLNLGARQIINRMSRAPAGEFKVVYLENIERMTGSAANALLKTLEEPLPNRLIVASTTNKEALLDTILSRAFIVDFMPLSAQQVADYLADEHAELDAQMQQFLVGFSLGKIGLVDTFLEHKDWDLDELSEQFAGLLSAIEQRKGVFTVNEYFSYFQNQGMWRHLCEAVAFLGAERGWHELVGRLVDAYRLTNTQVNKSHVAFDIALDVE